MDQRQQQQQQPPAQNIATENQSVNEQIEQAKADIGQSPTMAAGGLQSYETVATDEGVANPAGKK
jgi:hypothetical protein